MMKKLLAIAFAGLLSLAGASAVYAQDPSADPPADAGAQTAPEDPEGQPYPPDGVTDPNAEYPTDGATTDQGETGAEPPAEGAPADAPPSDTAPADAPPAEATPAQPD